MKALADRIATIFSKGHVDYIEDQNVISILSGKIVVDEKGVRGSGPSAERVKTIYQQFVMDIENPKEEWYFSFLYYFYVSLSKYSIKFLSWRSPIIFFKTAFPSGVTFTISFLSTLIRLK